MNRKKSLLFLTLIVSCCVFLPACGPDFILRGKVGISIILEGQTWSRVDLSGKGRTEDWVFKKGQLTVTQDPSGAKETFDYKITSKIVPAYIEILNPSRASDPEIPGKYKIIQIKRKLLKIARNGGKDDNDPTTREGGLFMVELINKP